MTNKAHPTIDLNTVDENVLIQKLKISPRLAKRIIAQRPYQSVDELKKVWGIDPKTLQRILLLVSVKPKVIPVPTPTEELLQPESAPLEENESEPVTMAVSSTEPAVPSAEPKEELALQKEAIKSETPGVSHAPNMSWIANVGLVLILLVGAYFRFVGLNWDENHHQHPDERFITMAANSIRGVNGISAYFDTDNSALNPLKFGSYTYGMLPLFLTRMVAEWVKMSDYDLITLVGRALSGLFDLAAVWMLYLLGKRLYNKRTGILAAALGAAAVLPIQLSHYFAVDSFSTVFVVASFYYVTLAIPLKDPKETITQSNLKYFAIFGFVVGLAGACKVNTLPVFGVIILAGIARLITSWKKTDFRTHLYLVLIGWALALLLAFVAFRIFQPYAFSGPGFFGIGLYQKWLDVIREVTNHVAGKSDWPPNHHWTNRSIIYAWVNLVVWGLGLPLGLAGWLGWAWAAWRMFKGEWRSHFLPFIWIAAYFIWQNSQFWRYMRYFLPIYPFIILFAAWALLEIYDKTLESRTKLLATRFKFPLQISDFRSIWRGAAAFLALGIVLVGTYAYAYGFTRIYSRPMTRITASRWMLENIPGPLNVIVESPQGNHSHPVRITNRNVIVPGDTPSIDIRILHSGTASTITTTDVRQIGMNLYFRLTRDEKGEDIITENQLSLTDDVQDGKQIIPFGEIVLNQDQTYYLHYKIHNSSQISLSGVRLGTDNKDEPTIPIDWNIQNQAPGILEGSFPIKPGSSIKLNCLEIEQVHQVFMSTETTLKVSLFKEGDDQNPLAVATQEMKFMQPGTKLTPVFKFTPIQLTRGKVIKVRYEILHGGPITLHGAPYTLETSWDDALPLSVDQYDGLGGIYSPMNLELYEPDTTDKRASMIQILAKSDYIVIPSNRSYDAMPRLPLRYPMTLKYYQALFDCNCTGDALENRAYGLKPPFKSPLGFDLVATFESPPSLGPLVISDQSADESFTVYDHPKVLIFKKSKDFSIDHVSALLYSVDLDQVIFQIPLGYTKSPTAMQLPPDRLTAQTNGGSWSSMFNREAFLNVNGVFGGVAWYLLLLLLGWMVFPIVFKAFPGLPDRGYPLIRMVGLIIVAWLAWLLGSLKILPFTKLTIVLCVGLVLVLSAGLAFRQRKVLLEYIRSNWKYLLGIELIFLILFLFDLYVRVGNPDLWHPWLGGEKPMDFAFFNAVLKSVYFPPENPWFSGHYINYYYYGYVLASIPTKLLGILPSIAYNLILPSWFAMIGTGVFCIAFNLIAGSQQGLLESKPGSTREELLPSTNQAKASRLRNGLPYLVGVISVIAILLLGNLYMVREFWIYLPELTSSGSEVNHPFERAGAVIGGAVQVLTGQAKLPGENSRWYFEASRPILNKGPDTPIAEFPYFTFLYGDLHAHLLTMPIYALVLGWMLGIILHPISRMKSTDRIISFILAGLFFGSFLASHTWDFPTFIGLGVLVILWDVWRTSSGSIQHMIQVIFGYELVFIGLALTLYRPFVQWFRTEYVSMELWTGARTPLVDYLFVFGLSIFVMVSLLIRDLSPDLKAAYQRWVSTSKHAGFTWRRFEPYIIFVIVASVSSLLWIYDYQILAFGLTFLAGVFYLIFFNRELSFLQRITWILFSIGLCLTMLVEVVVLKGDVGRSNMVFRFYNQTWFIFGIVISVALIDLLTGLSHWPRWVKYTWLFVLSVLALSAASYPLIATGMRMSNRWPDIQNPPHTLDGAKFMLGDASDPSGQSPAIYNDEDRKINLALDSAGIQYMQDHISGSPVIVEGHTQEYRWGSRYSIYTGLPSVMGWNWHIRQQNTLLDGSIIEKRINDVNDFYNTQDIQAANLFLNHYQVQYIVVSGLERIYYSAEGIAKFQEMVDQGMLQIVFGDNTSNTATIFKVLDIK